MLIGYPVWYLDVPAFVTDFVRQCDLRGKTVVPFATFGTTGVKWTLNTLEQICHNADIQYPFDYGIIKKDNYTQWIKNVQELVTAK